MSQRRRHAWWWQSSALLVLLLAGACSESGRTVRPAAPGVRPPQDASSVQDLNHKGIALLERGDAAAATQKFAEALLKDPRDGMSHNNLGTAHLAQNELYQAMQEFREASRLLPESAQPLHNLGLASEATGDYLRAAKYYEQALDLDPQQLPTIENLARAYIRLDTRPERTVELLRQIIARDKRPQWHGWAVRQVTRLQTEDQSPAARLRPPGDETPPTTQPRK